MKRFMGLLFMFVIAMNFTGCFNRYLNSSYLQNSYGDKHLVIMPIPAASITIEDSTILDFISQDFSVSKLSALHVLDSLLNENILRAFILNTDNILISKCRLSDEEDNRLAKSQNSADYITAPEIRSLKDFRIPSPQYLARVGCKADMVLLLRNINLDINFDVKLNGIGTQVVVVTTNNRYELEAEDLKYVIWDYNANQVVAQGKLDISNYYPRCEQLTGNKYRDTNFTCNNKMFWNSLLLLLGDSVAAETPFSKRLVDSIMPVSVWEHMKTGQLSDPSRDSAAIAQRIASVYPLLSTFASRNDSLFKLRDIMRLAFQIAPNGRISSIAPLDSVHIDSATIADMKCQLNINICDSIDNQKLYTFVTVGISKPPNTGCRLLKVKNGECRSRASIMSVVMKQLPNLRYAYNRRLRDGMNKDGKITFKFAIDETGKTISAKVIQSSIKDAQLENEVTGIIRTWKFGRIFNRGDVTEVVYPFAFSR